MSYQSARANPSAHRLAVSYRPAAALKPDPGNARTHPKRQIDQLVQSIRELRIGTHSQEPLASAGRFACHAFSYGCLSNGQVVEVS